MNIILAEAAVSSESHFVEWMIVVSSIALAIVTFALTYVTYLVHRDSVKALSHDNDNMHDIAKSEMDFNHKHAENIRRMKQIESQRRRY